MSVFANLNRGIFNGIFRRNSVFLSGIFAGAVVYEITYGSLTESIWDNMNKGRQWKDIKDRYA